MECYRGFAEAFETRTIEKMPRLHAVQPEGCATVAGPLTQGRRRAEPVTCTSQISGLQVASVLDAQEVMDRIIQTEGGGQMVSDASVLCWQRRMIREEGIYTEPAGATALAGLAAAVEKGLVQPDERVVCLVTGNGFKDLKSIEGIVGNTLIPLIEGDEI